MKLDQQTECEYYSAEMQDLAALVLLKDSGNTFLDIGCNKPKFCNNTFLLEKNGWKGICVDMEDFSEEFKKERKTPFYQVDTTGQEFIEILKEKFPKRFIHYISLDVDLASLATLENLIRNGFTFAFMTFEHDIHWAMTYERGIELQLDETAEWLCHGRTRDGVENTKYKSKKLLQDKGNTLLFENVCFHEKSTGEWLHPWEDWWINPIFFSYQFMLYLKVVMSKNLHFQDCFKRILLSREIDGGITKIL
tara:strand:- start:972 stop:1721 length:750 start_codon:yes stop_codon:yes gene_type:complete